MEINTAFLHGNPLAAIDIETTGQDPSIHEIVQIAIVPLTPALEVPVNDLHFFSYVCPLRPEYVDSDSMRIHGLSLEWLLENAPPPSTVVRLLVDWWENLPMAHGKRLAPLAHNWAYERSYMVPFLGPALFDQLFHPHPRDTMAMARFINDRAMIMGYDKPFKSIGLEALCSRYNIINKQAHNAYHDCVATANLYRAMLTSVV